MKSDIARPDPLILDTPLIDMLLGERGVFTFDITSFWDWN